MRFRREHLAHDIAKFRTYALHSHFSSSLDKNEWIYALLRRKMQAALPQCLLLAATEFQLTLDPTLRFSAYVDQALKIAARLQSQSALRPTPTVFSHPIGSSNPTGFTQAKARSVHVPHKRAPASYAGPSPPISKAKLAPLPALSAEAETAFLRTQKRCFSCAYQLGDKHHAHTNLLRCLTALKENWNGKSITLKSAKALVNACNT
jgi:hypothetical protein